MCIYIYIHTWPGIGRPWYTVRATDWCEVRGVSPSETPRLGEGAEGWSGACPEIDGLWEGLLRRSPSSLRGLARSLLGLANTLILARIYHEYDSSPQPLALVLKQRLQYPMGNLIHDDYSFGRNRGTLPDEGSAGI